jgi:hypothetical protein
VWSAQPTETFLVSKDQETPLCRALAATQKGLLPARWLALPVLKAHTDFRVVFSKKHYKNHATLAPQS